MPYTLAELVEGLVEGSVPRTTTVAGICVDSRQVVAGELFLALASDPVAARHHIDQAIARGAAAVVTTESIARHMATDAAVVIGVPDVTTAAGRIADRFYAHPSSRMTVIGVTGTNGKTSVSHYLAYALQRIPQLQEQPVCGLLGTLGYGTYGRLQSGLLTTPDVLSVHAQLDRIFAEGARHTVMEVSSHGLAQGRVAGVDFDIGVFTNLSREHLDYHADMREYGETKRQLFLTPGMRAAVINADDEFGRSLLGRLPDSLKVYAYSLSGATEGLDASITPVCGRVTAAHRYSLTLKASALGVEAEFFAPLLGQFNAHNLLAALATLVACGVDTDVAANALRNVPAVPGRMQSFGGTDSEPLVVVDYSHTPDGLCAALTALREQCTGRLWCVFGCGGDRDRGKRPEMGAAAAALADRIVLTDDNPRSEDGDDIIDDIKPGIGASSHCEIIRDRADAIAFAINHAAAADTVLVAGKGHEPYQEINGVRRPFSDAASVRLALRGRGS